MTTENLTPRAQEDSGGLLPTMLIAARRHSRITQKSAAFGAGLDPSYLCALERGRRLVPRPDVVSAICKGLNLSDIECAELNWAAAHDRVLIAVQSEGLISHATLVSAALRAAHYLEDRELAGLEQQIVRSIQSKQHLLDLEAEGLSSTVKKEKVMT
jgi:transcriptional regulator with XRE-family HTH domain